LIGSGAYSLKVHRSKARLNRRCSTSVVSISTSCLGALLKFCGERHQVSFHGIVIHSSGEPATPGGLLEQELEIDRRSGRNLLSHLVSESAELFGPPKVLSAGLGIGGQAAEHLTISGVRKQRVELEL
jgi:hypothetical protein